MDADKRFARKVTLFGAMMALAVVLLGSAVTQPPVDVKAFTFTVAGTPLTATDVDLNFLQFNKGVTCGVVFRNDNAAGGGNLLFNVSNGATSAAAGSDGAVGSASVPVFPGEAVPMDGRFTHAVVRSSSGNTACRIFPLFDR